MIFLESVQACGCNWQTYSDTEDVPRTQGFLGELHVPWILQEGSDPMVVVGGDENNYRITLVSSKDPEAGCFSSRPSPYSPLFIFPLISVF
jgi:hypothetical protein